jgi:hypothetical protein
MPSSRLNGSPQKPGGRPDAAAGGAAFAAPPALLGRPLPNLSSGGRPRGACAGSSEGVAGAPRPIALLGHVPKNPCSEAVLLVRILETPDTRFAVEYLVSSLICETIQAVRRRATPRHTTCDQLRLAEPPRIQELAPRLEPSGLRGPSAGIDTRRVCAQSRFSPAQSLRFVDYRADAEPRSNKALLGVCREIVSARSLTAY